MILERPSLLSITFLLQTCLEILMKFFFKGIDCNNPFVGTKPFNQDFQYDVRSRVIEEGGGMNEILLNKTQSG